MPRPGSGHESDRGQAIPLLLALVALAAASAVGVATLGQRLVVRAEVQAAADAAALAGVQFGRDAARSVAAANATRLVGWDPVTGGPTDHPTTVDVTVESERQALLPLAIRAVARATME